MTATRPYIEKVVRQRMSKIPANLLHEQCTLDEIKRESSYFEKYRTIKLESGDAQAFKILVTKNHQEIYLAGIKGLTCLSFDAYSGKGKSKFSQKIGSH